jgi:tRNA threonylcarbamoyladenosine biosynthesis protein TsaB
MNILALDTCFPALTVAIGRGVGTPEIRIVSRSEPMATGHAERMLPLIGDLLRESGIGMADIDRIAVTIGPGSFTGTRIGIAAARAFKLARGIPIVTFSSLEAMALSPLIALMAGEDIAVAVDAHRGEAYVGLFDGGTRRSLTPPRMLPLTELASLPRGRPVIAVGTAADRLVQSVTKAGGMARAEPGVVFPDMAATVARAGERQPAAGSVEPLYLRPPDAKPQEGKTLARAGA